MANETVGLIWDQLSEKEKEFILRAMRIRAMRKRWFNSTYRNRSNITMAELPFVPMQEIFDKIGPGWGQEWQDIRHKLFKTGKVVN